MNKKTGMAVATTMAFALGLSSMALADDEPIKVAYLTKQIANETWQLMVQGCIDMGPEYGFEVTNMDCDMNAAKQVEQVESCIEAGYDLIAISPADYDALDDVC